MKKVVFLLIIVLLFILASGCSSGENLPENIALDLITDYNEYAIAPETNAIMEIESCKLLKYGKDLGVDAAWIVTYSYELEFDCEDCEFKSGITSSAVEVYYRNGLYQVNEISPVCKENEFNMFISP